MRTFFVGVITLVLVSMLLPNPVHAQSGTARIFGGAVVSGCTYGPVDFTSATAFTTSAAGTITGIYYYKLAQQTSGHAHVALWLEDGTQLASAVSSDEIPGPGWQWVPLPQPVAITPGVTYLVSQYASDGTWLYYCQAVGMDSDTFYPVNSGALTAVYGAYSNSGDGFPEVFDGSMNWVDVGFQPDAQPTETVTPPPPAATPAYIHGVTLSTGHELAIERRITTGDIAVVLAVLVSAVITLVRGFVEIPKQWLSR